MQNKIDISEISIKDQLDSHLSLKTMKDRETLQKSHPHSYIDENRHTPCHKMTSDNGAIFHLSPNEKVLLNKTNISNI